MANSVFEVHRDKLYKYRFDGVLQVDHLVGGIPSDPKVAEGWIKKTLGADNQALISEMVAKTMLERGLEADKAVDEVVKTTKLNGFKRDDEGLYIEGRQLKAALKEAASIRWPERRWGPTRKGTKAFIAEHIFVVQDRLHLGVTEPSGIQQRFVSTFRGTGIQYEEYVTDAKVPFTVRTDNDFTDDEWADLWTTGEQQGIGATRSQSFGRYNVVEWAKAK
jgi:hypothetical protein